MYVNNTDVHKYGANLTLDYKYTPPTISNEYFKGRYRSNYVLLTSNYELGTLVCPMVFTAETLEHVTAKKSAFEQQLFGRCDIDMEDGYSYFAFLDDIGDDSHPCDQVIEVSYTFKCIRHKDMVTSEGNSVFCQSTLPFTDCILSVTVGESGSNYAVGSVTFPSVTQGQRLVVDGINKRILVNGAPAADSAEWIKFPYLTPGENNIKCNDTLTIQYYPVFF